MPFIRTFSVSDGVVASESNPDQESLYATPDELTALYGCTVTEEQLRFVQSVINAHCNRASLWPCEIEEPSIRVPEDRQETRLAVTPVVRILEAAGRYSYGRRDRINQTQYMHGMAPILALTAASRPQWSAIDVNAIEVDPASGVIYMPWTIYLAPWTLLKVRYIGGYVQIPARVKAAVAEILNNMSQKGASDRVRYGVGRLNRQFASSSWITPAAEQLLQPFVVSVL